MLMPTPRYILRARRIALLWDTALLCMLIAAIIAAGILLGLALAPAAEAVALMLGMSR
jgi:hypothetical protein